MKVDIITPQKVEFQDEVEYIGLPTLAGRISVLKSHIPLVSVLKPGLIKMKTLKRGEVSFEAEGGILMFSEDKLTLLLKDFKIKERF
jgi:F0F1-type ATP synthase epsilon subunit